MSNDPAAAAGVDLKYAVTQGLSADLTVNTDFAQVEADEQQANLTRFSLFFPEKREFFLENQGTFSFGGVQLTGNLAGNQNNDQVAPILFYSRRIGLNGSRVVPLRTGGRLTGRAGAYSIGVVSTQTGAEDDDLVAPAPSTNFSVVRVKRDILRRSSVGLIATGVNPSGSVGSNRAYGLDGTFAFFDNLAINTYWAKTDTPGATGVRHELSCAAQLRRAIATASSSNGSPSARTSNPRSASSAAATCAATSGSSASARGPPACRSSGSSAIRVSPGSPRTGRGGSNRASWRASSRSSS